MMNMDIILDQDEFRINDIKKASIYIDQGILIIDIDGSKVLLNPEITMIHLEETQ